MDDTKDLLDYHIYPNLSRAEALSDLNPQDKGSYYLLTCPDCGKREAYIYKTGLYIKCNRMDKCAYAKSLWDYIQQKRGLTNQETLRELARLANYNLLDLQGYSEEEAEKARKKANILEDALEFFKEQLWAEKNKETLEYLLQKRGYSQEEVKTMELGFNPGEEETESYLVNKGYAIEEIKAIFKYLHWREDYKLVIPWRDPVGRLKSLWGRLVRPLKEGEKEKDKYKPITEAEKGTLFNLHTSVGQKELTLVEGFLDALIANAKGVKGIVAIGGDLLSKEQIENIKRYGIRQVTICLDGDEAGRKGTEHSIEALHREEIKVFAAELPAGLDPDDLIRERGVGSLQEEIAKAISGARWKAKRIIFKHDITSDKGKQEATDEALAFAERLSEPLDTMTVLETLANALGISSAMLESKLKEYHQKKAWQKLEKEYKELLSEAQRQLQQGKAAELGKFLEQRIQTFESEYQQTIAKPSKNFADRLQAQYEEETAREKRLLGYTLNRFYGIAQRTDGIQPGLYILGAETNIGKTAFLTNVFLDMLLANPQTKGLYLSLDDSYKVIVRRWVGILTRIDLNKLQRKQETPEAQKSVNKAYETLIRLAQTGRITVKDLSEINHIQALDLEIRQQAKDSLFVFIDGLYNLEVGKECRGIREENIERANKIKALVDTYQIPILTSAEIRKRNRGEKANSEPCIDDLMETGKFGYNANLVWLLYPEDAEKAKKDEEITLILDYAKNKLSWFKGSQKLRFYRRQGRLEEMQEEHK